MDAVWKALPALIAGLIGILAAYLWFSWSGPQWLPALGLAAVALLGYVAHWAGEGMIRPSPIRSVPFLEAWGLLLMASGALGAAIVVVLAVLLARLTPVGTPADQKALLSAAIGALS